MRYDFFNRVNFIPKGVERNIAATITYDVFVTSGHSLLMHQYFSSEYPLSSNKFFHMVAFKSTRLRFSHALYPPPAGGGGCRGHFDVIVVLYTTRVVRKTRMTSQRSINKKFKLTFL